MKQPKQKQNTSQVSKTKTGTMIRVDYILIIFAYILVPVATPIFEAFDANGPKFLAISLLNLLAFGYLLAIKPIHTEPGRLLRVFKNKLGLIYVGFLCVVLLSFFKAINIYESIITFSKIFTIFSAAYIVSIVLSSDRRYLTWLAAGFSLMLLFDSFTVLYHIMQYLAGTVPSIYVIKSVYSNKNILSAAIFVKVPFALWLFTYKDRWMRILAIFTLFFAILATLFMSTRTFYIGLIVVSVAFIAYNIIRYYRDRDGISLTLLTQYTIALILAVFTFAGTQSYLYPKKNNDALAAEYNVGLVTRLSTISGGEGGRNHSWKRTIRMIGEDPLLGVGTGNWKVRVLKYENPESQDYTYMYKNHNDFLEITSETGIIGGLLYLALFLLIGYSFIAAFLKHDSLESGYNILFLPAFGLLAYSFDAFFNFPADRPEIGALFAVYVAAGIAFSPAWLKMKPATKTDVAPPTVVNGGSGSLTRLYVVLFSLLMIVCMSVSIYALVQNYNSIVLQRLVKSEMAQGKLTLPADKFMTGFPSFPTLSLEGEPIAVHKGRYLVNESKFQQAIDILKADRSSPYDTRQEFFISMAYFQLGKLDSSLVYSKKVYEVKPLFYNNTSNLCRSLDGMGQRAEAIKIMEQFLNKVKTVNEAWVFTSSLYDNSGDFTRAAAVMDSALKYLPADSTIIRQQQMMNNKAKIKPYESVYFAALEQFKQKKYPEAIRLFSEFIAKEPRLAEAYDFRAFAYFFNNDHKNSITDVEHALALGYEKPNLLNLRGVCYHLLGNDEAACRDFKRARILGDKDAVANIQKFCSNQ